MCVFSVLFFCKAIQEQLLLCHLHISEREMSMLAEACYCCGERGPSASPLKAEMTPSEQRVHYFYGTTSNFSPGLISWLREVMCKSQLLQINKPCEDANQDERDISAPC